MSSSSSSPSAASDSPKPVRRSKRSSVLSARPTAGKKSKVAGATKQKSIAEKAKTS